MDEQSDIRFAGRKKFYHDPKFIFAMSLWSGIIGFFAAVPAIFFGHMLLTKSRRKQVSIDENDKRLTVTGLFFGYAGLFLWVIIAVNYLNVFFI